MGNAVTGKARTGAVELLRSAGLRCTPVRVGMLRLLGEAGRALSAAQLLERMPGRTDKVTLYRTLNTLTGKSLLHRVRGDDQIWRYGMGKPRVAAHQAHAHFVCDECGTVECLANAPVAKRVRKRAGIRRGYRVDYSEVLVHGSCAGCRR